ncbi:protein FAM53A [Tenrec ecaudatus]|uniref:protein FAM53A n=1 Tax=Tenrec ecaudatus TaxID=94439 RepID=UPI003F5984FA
MVTLITEKLQNQSLDDLARKTYDASPYSTERVNKSGGLFSFGLNVVKSPWKVVSGGRSAGGEGHQHQGFPFPPPSPFGPAPPMGLQWRPEAPSAAAAVGSSDSDVSLSEHAGQPLAPPTKRHCRSLSEPDELARCRSPWRPGGSKVWTPVSKRRCNSGGSATLQRGPGRAPAPSGPARPAAGSPAPSGPRPASASSGVVEGGPAGPGELSSRRRLSLSQEHLADAAGVPPSASSTPTATPELSRRMGLLRSRSQPCVLGERKGRRKRRREEDARWTRPALDFLKMTRTLKNSKSLCSLDDEDDEEDEAHVKTVVSSPCDGHHLASAVTPASSPARPRPWTPREPEGPGATSDGDSAGEEEEGVFPLDCGDLDLEQIENN